MLSVESSDNNYETKLLSFRYRVQPVLWCLRLTCKPDPQFPTGVISSIYYDTRDWVFLREKINSDFQKTKFRIRWYSDTLGSNNRGVPYAEVKYKVGGLRHKTRTELPLSVAWLATVSLSDQELLKIPILLKKTGVFLDYDLFPTFQVTYQRHRFIEPITNARICLDFDICAPKINSLMLPRSNPVRLNVAVFELKGTVNTLPGSLYFLTEMGFKKESFSKYLACYQQIFSLSV